MSYRTDDEIALLTSFLAYLITQGMLTIDSRVEGEKMVRAFVKTREIR
jgi:hypothetical protein